MARAVFGLMLGIVISGCAEAASTRAPAQTQVPLEREPPLVLESPAPLESEAEVPATDPASEHVTEVRTPAIDGDVIRRIVRSHADAVHACYELGHDLDPALAGRIAISFTIGPTGAVTEARAEAPESFPYPEVPACIVDEIRTWTFPAPRGGGSVIVSYPTH